MMKQILFLALLVFVGTLPVHSQKQVEIMQPKVEFDVKMASEMLNDGDAGIAGVAYYEKRTPIGIKVGETIYGRPGIVVTLYPLTPYIEEYLSLKKKNKQGKRIATISRLASCFRIESKIYGVKGEFIFKGLRPGKYYIETLVHFPSGVGGTEVSGIVEIKQAGETVETKLKHIY